MEYRSLTVDEITQMEHRGCRADDWSRIGVAEDFTPTYIYNVEMHGDVRLGLTDKSIEVEGGLKRHSGIRNAVLCDVTIGDNCLIDNIGCHISGYTIGDDCCIMNVGRMAADGGATCGQGTVIAVMNEAGPGNVTLYDGLTSQMAALMVTTNIRPEVTPAVAPTLVGDRVKITNTREIVNTTVADDAEVCGAAKLTDSTVGEAYIGSDVVCESTIVSRGASVTDGARLYSCFVGEACHIGRGFTAESSLFFANSHMDNGEAAAAFCGPFSVSHHKATLLIGGMYTMYNAGSTTNYSNHAYKTGPIHSGTLARGTKTASGTHIVWPARIGAFSVCIGKIDDHPQTDDLPFSYLFGSEHGTMVAPGRNAATAGTARDIDKWQRRDRRPLTARRDIVNLDWLNPCIVASVVRGRELLLRALADQGQTDEYTVGTVRLRRSSLLKGIDRYDMLIKMFFAAVLADHEPTLPTGITGTGQWVDLAGLVAPKSEVTDLVDAIEAGDITTTADIERHLTDMHNHYGEYRWNFAYSCMCDYYHLDTLTADDARTIAADGQAARAAWLAATEDDAARDRLLGTTTQA